MSSTTTETKKSTKGEAEKPPQMIDVSKLTPENAVEQLIARAVEMTASDQLQALGQMIGSPSGLILITGPTGSGKTATLYASLKKLNDGKRKINTIEDPIEYAIPGLRQSQVNPAIELSFSELLRGVLRQ